MTDTREWTLMFYFASDNPLAPSIVTQLKAIKDAGFHTDANVIARFDPHPANVPAHIFEVNLINKLKARGKSNIGFRGNDPFVRTLVADKLWQNQDIIKRIQDSLNSNPTDPDEPDRVMGVSDVESTDGLDFEQIKETKNDPIVFAPPIPSAKMSGEQTPRESLLTFLEFCRDNYPARHYMLFVLGHGVPVGNDLFLFDEHTSKQPASKAAAEHSLPLKELRKVLDEASLGDKLELISFHSCSMSSLEVGYELKGAAKYMLASQGPAFVGSWPYRQMLIRIFNDLEAPAFRSSEIQNPQALLARLKGRSDPLSNHLFEQSDPYMQKLISQSVAEEVPRPKIIEGLSRVLNSVLSDSQLLENEFFKNAQLSNETKRRMKTPAEGVELKWLNRRLLEDGFATLIKTKQPPRTLKETLTLIFYYCLYNSYDFQLAGYSFDLCLSDLEKIKDTEILLTSLAEKLKKGVTDALAQYLILLAHWRSQSYWQENYTDLYDFCFCLEELCRLPGEYEIKSNDTAATTEIMKEMKDACNLVMDVLRRGSQGADDGLVIRSESAGPAYQYSHGFSVFFPWSQPRDGFFWNAADREDIKDKKEPTGYKAYNFAATGWSQFLDEYFAKTMRPTHSSEEDEREPIGSTPNLDRQLLDEITSLIFNEQGQLKIGPKDVTGKDGPHDPAGDDCDCGTIKNYPPFTRATPSRTFFQRFRFD